MPPCVGSGCRQISVATGSASAGSASSPTSRSPSRVCRVTGVRRAGSTVAGLISLMRLPSSSAGLRRSRFVQHGWCQCLRSSGPTLIPSAGQATTCGVPGVISWSHPGHRYALAVPAPGYRPDHPVPVGPGFRALGPGHGRRRA